TVSDMLVDIQASMLAKATAFRDSHIHDPKDMDELTQVVQNGWALSWWCESKECETKVKDATRASTRCMPVDQPVGQGTCIVCGKPARRKVIFGKSY
ncbi:MAG: proline--tRNA ligase, partial [Chloroflexota bacterium]